MEVSGSGSFIPEERALSTHWREGWMEEVVNVFYVLSRHLLQVTEENNEKPYPGILD
jgi:hypothetical protein